MDVRLIHQFERRLALDPNFNKRGRKPKSLQEKKREQQQQKQQRAKARVVALLPSDDEDDSSDDDEVVIKGSPKKSKSKSGSQKKKNNVPYISQTLSGRTPKPPERYQEKETTKSSRQRHKSNSQKFNNSSSSSKKDSSFATSDDDDFEAGETVDLYDRIKASSRSKHHSSSSNATTASPISPALSTGSSSGSKKGKIGITIKKSPNADRPFETTLLCDDDDSEEEEEGREAGGSSNSTKMGEKLDEEDETEEEEIDDDETDDAYERFRYSLVHGENADSTPGSSVAPTAITKKRPLSSDDLAAAGDPKLGQGQPQVNLKKMCSATSRDLVLSSTIIESDSEYETEEIIELREWYPPDYWKSSLAQEISLTDVTVNDFTVTLTESRRSEGFFKEL